MVEDKTDPNYLDVLAEAVENATASAARLLDPVIAQAIHPGSRWRTHPMRPGTRFLATDEGPPILESGDDTPRYTSSLDAAASLIPDDCWWTLDSQDEAHIFDKHGILIGGALCDNPARKLCAAALRTLAEIARDKK